MIFCFRHEAEERIKAMLAQPRITSPATLHDKR
jgi:hypothetical protein